MPFGSTGDEDEEPTWPLACPGLDDPTEEHRRLHHILELAREAAQGEGKVAVLRRLLTRVREPAIVFTEYRDTLEQLARQLEDEAPLQLHGGLTPKERAAVLQRFAGGSARLLLATDAGSEGLNLHHHCRLVVNLELPWTPTRLEQRAGRVDRIGQARRVHVISLVADGTCEESTLMRLTERLQRARDAMALLSQPITEQQVARAVFEQVADETAAAVLPPFLVTGDFGRDAQQEAIRIGLARGLMSRSHDVEDRARPVITQIHRRRSRVRSAEAIWLFRITYAAANRVVWTPLLPLRGAPSPGLRSRARTRYLLEPARLTDRVHDESAALLREWRLTVCSPAATWMERESRLMAHIRGHRARLSAGLLQTNLFGHGEERLAAARTAALDQALSRCETRLADLSALADLQVDGVSLVCAVLLD